MKLFDLHCDTAYEMYIQDQKFEKNTLHISLERAKGLEEYRQIMAVWSDDKLSDEECYEAFLKIRSSFLSCNSVPSEFGAYAWSVEDARLLCGKIERLDTLRSMGVKFLIPMWKGKSIIGGAFDTDTGLTDFGKQVIKRCFDLGIIPDISHCSTQSTDDIFGIAERRNRPVIASHSCSYSVCRHPRNLRDEQFKRIMELGGIVGVSFCAYHLSSVGEDSTDETVISHLGHYLELGGESMLCLGADMDGAPMPKGISGIESIPALYEKMCRSFGKNIADKISYSNAFDFAQRYL